MNRQEFEHVIAAAANVVQDDEFIVIGSQAILGSFPKPPRELLVSMEADLYPRHRPEEADRVEGALGDGSAFEQQFGYFAHAVGPETARAPAGWMERLVRVDIPPRVASERRPVAWCMEPHDLVVAKLARGSERDREYAAAAIAAGLVDRDLLLERAATLPLSEDRIAAITATILAVT